MKSIKICHITSVHNTDDVRIFNKECVSLTKQDDYKVYLVGAGISEIREGVNIVGVGGRPKSRFRRMFSFTSEVVKQASILEADIFHLHDPELLRYALKLKRQGAKVIFDSHENLLDSIDEKTYMPVLLRKIMKLYFRFLQNKVIKKIDGVIVVTPQMIESYKPLNDNVVLIPNYPYINDTDDDHKKTVKGRFIFAGGITAQWSHKEIITAIENIDNVEYYLLGSGDNRYIEELKSLKGWNKVKYRGKVSFSEVQEELSKAQFAFALCKPGKNTYYNQGSLGNTKIFEAMEKGKPVIATDFELWEEIVEEGRCGICVNPNDIDSIEFAIREMMNKRDKEIDEMGANGKAIIKRDYSWQKSAEDLMAAYRLLEHSQDIC